MMHCHASGPWELGEPGGTGRVSRGGRPVTSPPFSPKPASLAAPVRGLTGAVSLLVFRLLTFGMVLLRGRCTSDFSDLCLPRRAMPDARHDSNHSITSSAIASSTGGTVRPSILAAVRLMIKSIFFDSCTGRSAGFAPLRMRPE